MLFVLTSSVALALTGPGNMPVFPSFDLGTSAGSTSGGRSRSSNGECFPLVPKRAHMPAENWGAQIYQFKARTAREDTNVGYPLAPTRQGPTEIASDKYGRAVEAPNNITFHPEYTTHQHEYQVQNAMGIEGCSMETPESVAAVKESTPDTGPSICEHFDDFFIAPKMGMCPAVTITKGMKFPIQPPFVAPERASRVASIDLALLHGAAYVTLEAERAKTARNMLKGSPAAQTKSASILLERSLS